MTREQRLNNLLQNRFPGAEIQVIDDSADHHGHIAGENGETHYRLRIRAAAFAGLTRVQVHRMINDAAKSEFDAGLHSLVIERAES